jgi:hypothetical protein
MDPLPGVVITSREIYDAVVRLTGRVDVVIEQQTHTSQMTQDHETRIRAMERSRWPLHSLTVLVALGALALSFFGK